MFAPVSISPGGVAPPSVDGVEPRVRAAAVEQHLKLHAVDRDRPWYISLRSCEKPKPSKALERETVTGYEEARESRRETVRGRAEAEASAKRAASGRKNRACILEMSVVWWRTVGWSSGPFIWLRGRR